MMGERQTGHPALFYEFSLERPHYGNALAEHRTRRRPAARTAKVSCAHRRSIAGSIRASSPHGLVPSWAWRRRLATSEGRVSNSIHSSSAARPVSARIFHAGCLNDGGLRLLSGKNHLHRGGARDRPSCHRAYASSNGSADRTSEERARDTSYDGTRRSSPVIRPSEV